MKGREGEGRAREKAQGGRIDVYKKKAGVFIYLATESWAFCFDSFISNSLGGLPVCLLISVPLCLCVCLFVCHSFASFLPLSLSVSLSLSLSPHYANWFYWRLISCFHEVKRVCRSKTPHSDAFLPRLASTRLVLFLRCIELVLSESYLTNISEDI